MRKAIITLGLLLSFCLALSVQVHSAAPQLISFQGLATDSAGTPLDGPADIVEFTIYDSDSAGIAIWSEEHTSVEFSDGLFSVLLGSVSELVDTVFNDTSRYLGISLDGGVSEIMPRIRLVSSPYAFRVNTIDGSSGGVISGDVSIQSNLSVDGEIDATGAENKIRFHYNALGDLPSALTYHGMFAHVHLEGKAYYSHAGNWVPLANELHNHGWQDNGSSLELSTTTDSVGIGTSSPTEKLEVDGIIYSTSGGIKFPDATIQTTAAGGGGAGGWNDDGTVVRLTTISDSVGIGTTTPSEKLDIVGNAEISGKATIGPGHTNTGTNSFVTGESNTASGHRSTVGGGYLNVALDSTATVGGGRQNGANGKSSTVAGGHGNSVSLTFGSIGGGTQNVVGNTGGTVSGGANNWSSGLYSNISGGNWNRARGDYSVVGGGGGAVVTDSNHAGGDYSTISGGNKNTVTHEYGTIGGGAENYVDSIYSTVAGGRLDTASGRYSTVGGGTSNSASGAAAVISGGSTNSASALYSSVGGGHADTASNEGSTISGGVTNKASGTYSVVGGGQNNVALGDWSTVGGGELDSASGAGATVAGGSNNVASAGSSTVGGGYSNTSRNLAATIAGGYQNRAWGDYASVLGGLSNEAKGAYAVVLGGRFARADSAYSFAVGWRAHAMHRGSYVFADTAGSIDFNSTADNQFSIRAVGGTRIFSNPTLTTGVTLAAGAGAWVAVSDSTVKRNIRPVDEFEVLEKISKLPISRWSYETQSEDIEHIGPMAQDFYAAFGLGDDDRGICTIDPDGVSLAAIKALYEENQKLKEDLNSLQDQMLKLLKKMEKIEAEK